MSDAQLYVALVKKSITLNKENDLSIPSAPENAYDVAAREILRSYLYQDNSLSNLFKEIDRIREEARN